MYESHGWNNCLSNLYESEINTFMKKDTENRCLWQEAYQNLPFMSQNKTSCAMFQSLLHLAQLVPDGRGSRRVAGARGAPGAGACSCSGEAGAWWRGRPATAGCGATRGRGAPKHDRPSVCLSLSVSPSASVQSDASDKSNLTLLFVLKLSGKCSGIHHLVTLLSVNGVYHLVSHEM